MTNIKKETLKEIYNNIAFNRKKWKNRNKFYHKSIERYFSFIVPQNSKVLDIGCADGDLLASLNPAVGIGVDFSEFIINEAKTKHTQYKFICDDAENVNIEGTFDYILLSDTISSLWDIHKTLDNIHKNCNQNSRLVISNYNYLWESILKLGEKLGLKQKQPNQSWLTSNDIKNLLSLTGFELIKTERKLLIPKYIPVINFIFNKVLANLPILNRACLTRIYIAKPIEINPIEYSVSIIVPARNEKGNIENAILRTPEFGKSQEFIFIEGHSSDHTYEEMLRVQSKYNDKNIKVLKQSGKGKGNAVREAFDLATGEVLMILDADLTTPPEEMYKFYDALKNNKGEFINGCRLVYPMEKEAMRFLNFLANKFFGWFFTYLLGQHLKDTLCGTKVLRKCDYEKIKANRAYFGDFDPFGDFDLLFGAAKLNLKITEIIVRYKDREYGSTQISRFKHGWLLIQMSMFAVKKIKFI